MTNSIISISNGVFKLSIKGIEIYSSGWMSYFFYALILAGSIYYFKKYKLSHIRKLKNIKKKK